MTACCLFSQTAPLALAQSIPDLSAPGPFHAGWRTVTITRAAGTTFNARLCYPSPTTVPAGQNAPLASAVAPCPAIAFGHGFLQTVDRYQSHFDHLASWGYIVIAPSSEGSLFPSHANFAFDLRTALTYLEQQNATPSSFLSGAVSAGRYGISGHSMGGGASILAAQADQRIIALATMAAAETNPSAITAISSVSIPVMLLAGSSDTIVPPATNNTPMYTNAPGPRQAPVITGGFHCGFQDVSVLGCDSGTMTRATQLAISRREYTAWFDLYLRNDQSRWQMVWGPFAVVPEVVLASDPRASIAPASLSLAASPGLTTVGTLSIANTGSQPRSFAMSGESASFTASFNPAVAGPIAPGGSATVEVTLNATQAAVLGTAPLLISARDLSDGGTRASASWTINFGCLADIVAIGGRPPPDGLVSGDDFNTFINAFASEQALADVVAIGGGLPADGLVTGDDFVAFVNAFSQTCP